MIKQHIHQLIMTKLIIKHEEITKEELEVKGEFPDEFLFQVATRPWFVDMANYKATGIIPKEFNWSQRKKFLHDARFYVWDNPHLFRAGADNLLRRSVKLTVPMLDLICLND